MVFHSQNILFEASKVSFFPPPLTIASTNSCSPSWLASLYSLRTLQSTAGYQDAKSCHQGRLWKWLVWNPSLLTSFPKSAGMVLLSLSLLVISLAPMTTWHFRGLKMWVSLWLNQFVASYIDRELTVSNATHMALSTRWETFLKNCVVKFEILIKKQRKLW